MVSLEDLISSHTLLADFYMSEMIFKGHKTKLNRIHVCLLEAASDVTQL